jgi:hypothetical protein
MLSVLFLKVSPFSNSYFYNLVSGISLCKRSMALILSFPCIKHL